MKRESFDWDDRRTVRSDRGTGRPGRNRRNAGTMRKVRRRSRLMLLWTCLLAVLTASAVFSLAGFGSFRRLRYKLSGGNVQSWEEAALEQGVVSSAEEYYYDQLPENLQEAYRELYVHIMSDEDSGEFLALIQKEDFWKVHRAVLADHPEMFWIGTSAQIETDLAGKVMAYDLETAVPVESRPSMKEKLEAAADACIAQISPDASDYEKIRFVYEYLINTVDYQSGSADSQNIQSALLYRASVCAGYSRAFQYILHRMGLFCTYITGQIADGGDHAWNMVRIDGEYYYVDVTWGDPVFTGQTAAPENRVTDYNYLCCTEDDLFKTHTPDGGITLPPCTSNAYNYYILNDCYYESFDYDTVYDLLMNSVWNGEAAVIMKFGDQQAYESAKYELFQGSLLEDPLNYLMDINAVNSWNYKYDTDDRFLVITLYW